MKFRGTVQQPQYVEEPKSIAPALLSDPAFSPDPYSHPYYVLNGEPASPPVGHPALKSKNRRQLSTFAHPISASDLAFDLIPPPNSPVAPAAVPTATHLSFPTRDSPPPTLSASQTRAPVAFVAETSSKERKRLRMPFLSRRKSSAEPPQPAPSATRSAGAENDVTQKTRPAPAPRNASEPSKPVKARLGFPMRSATFSGASTPTTRSAAKSVAPSQISNSRTQDLDRIDELDETNPWGIALHHGGPYEAATQALKSSNSSTAYGNGSSAFTGYPRQALHAHGNLYIPPQVPTGVSLNLSPGQILPRNFDISPQAQYPRQQAPAGPPFHRTPPSVLMPGTPISRRVSLPLPSPGPLPNPHPISSPILPRVPLPPREPQPALQPKPEPEPDSRQDMPFDIGMAMLLPAASTSASSLPSIYFHSETSDDSEFDPYDPVHLEREHPRTPSLRLNSSAEQSRGPTPDPQSESVIPQPSVFRNGSENPDTLRQQSVIPRGDSNTPPPYSDVELNTSRHLQPTIPNDPSRSPSREPSPTHSPPVSHDNHNDQPGHLNPLPAASVAVRSSADRREVLSDINEVADMPSTPEGVYRLGLSSVQDRDVRGPQQVTQLPLAQVLHERSHNIRTFNQEGDARNTGQISPNAPIYNSGERFNISGPLSVQDAHSTRYAPSTHHTISTYTSSQMPNGPPPNRHVPKHLVMPTPLQNNPNSKPAQNRPQLIAQPVLPSHFSSAQVQLQVRAQPRGPYSQRTPYNQTHQVFAPVQQNPIPRANKIIPQSKLRKKVSTKMTSASNGIPPPPIVTTVSFSPPVVGFAQSAPAEQYYGRSKAEKTPKRLLSKRRTDF